MATGDLSSIADTLEFEDSMCYNPHLIRITDNMYAIVYMGGSNDGFLKTVGIDDSGNIDAAVTDFLEYDTDTGSEPFIFHIEGSIYGIAYMGEGSHGYLKTLSIADSGTIGSVIDALEFQTTNIFRPCVIHLAGDYYAIAYLGYDTVAVAYEGMLKTIKIETNGTITGVVDNVDFETNWGDAPDIIRIADTIYAIAYVQGDQASNGGVGIVKTISISDVGVIGSVVDTYTYEATNGTFPKIAHMTGTYYALAYIEDRDTVRIVTFTISAAGTFGAEIDSTDVEISNAVTDIDFVALFSSVAMVAYTKSGDNKVRTYTIDAGEITDEPIDSLVFDAVGTSYSPDLNRVENKSFYVVAYELSNITGAIKTFGVDLPTTYPSDAITRVSGLVHRWSPGNYTLEVFLGDVRTLWDAPPITRKAKSVEPEEEMITEKDVLRLPELPRPPVPYVDPEGRMPAGPPEEIETRRPTLFPGITGPRVPAPPYEPFETKLTDIQLSRLLRARRLERKQREETTAPLRAVTTWVSETVMPWFRSILPW